MADRPETTMQEIQDWLRAKLAEQLEIDPVEIDPRAPFSEYGLASRDAVVLSGDLMEWLGRELSPTLLYEYPSIAALAAHLAEARTETRTAARTLGSSEPVAIVGIGCRFPGAAGPEGFWRLLREGVDAVTEVPAERWDAGALYSADPLAPGKMNTRWGGFLGGVDRFDAGFFGISPREAAQMDPQQRLLLEVAWEALEDAGQVPAALSGSATGVFLGISGSDYGGMLLRRSLDSDPYAGPGNALSIAANRISYLLNFRGPSLAVDTACSSSLVAVHLACHSLWSGESELALAGGVNLILSPAITVNFSKAGLMAPDGRCKAFDESANGYVRGEGAGMVVLKPLSRALADGDAIYAVIRGSAVNQDGRSNGLTAPNLHAQESVLRAAYARAGVAPGDVGYVEAHGTGTALGDPIELHALGAVLAADRPAGRLCRVGSVKTNIGHLEAAAGIAGLIKTALALHHRSLPPSLHFKTPNPHIRFDRLPLAVQQTFEPWPEGLETLAGVSSFGFGGTNAHVVLEAAPPAVPRDAPPDDAAQLLVLSARSPEALRELAERCAELLVSQAEPLGPHPLPPLPSPPLPPGEGERTRLSVLQELGGGAPLPADGGAMGEGTGVRSHGALCASLALRRSHHEHRLAVTGRSAGELRQALAESGAGTPGRRGKLAFVFSGQGTPWPGMGRDLLAREPVLREALEACDAVFRPLAGWSIAEALTQLEERRLEDTEIAQPVITAVQIALAALWRSWGIAPEAVVGHSVGEVAAACVAGALSVEQAMTLVHHRGRLMQSATGQGTMAAVRLAPGEIERLLDEHGRDGIAIAALNSPASTVVSGNPLTLDSFLAALRARDVAVRPLDVRYAFHSGQMVRFEAELVERLDGFRPRAGALPVYSTLTGRLCAGEELTSAYWGRSLREPVLFAAAVDALIGDGFETFLEIGPHPALAGPLRQCLEHRGREGTVLASMRRDADARMTMLGSAGALYVQGYEIDWTAIYPGDSVFTRFPSYPWQRERYWIEGGIEETAKDGSVGSVESVAPVDTGRPIDFSLMFFAASDGASAEAQAAPGFDKYRLVLEAAKFADRHGFASVSVPERHFTGFGCLYPNPAVLHAAVARETKRVRLRAGSVVLPLHNPIRVAEEWSMVDNLSGGRVELSFASGWNPDDFILAPGNYHDRQAEMVRGIRTVQQLWRGEAVQGLNGSGEMTSVKTFPTPVQADVPIWITAAGNPATFALAGELGADVLTHLLDQDFASLGEKIATYRAARRKHGHDPETGRVSVMVHTFLGEDLGTVREQVRKPFSDYLKSIFFLLRGLSTSRGREVDVESLPEAEREEFVAMLFERFFSSRALFGTVDSCAPLVAQLQAIGVDEISCLLDFGVDTDLTLRSLPLLRDLKDRYRRRISAPPAPRAEEIGDLLYEMRWEPAASVPPVPPPAGANWLIVADRQGIGRSLAELLEGQGQRCRVIDPSADAGDFAGDFTGDMAAAVRRPLQGVVYLGSLDAAPLEPHPPDPPLPSPPHPPGEGGMAPVNAQQKSGGGAPLPGAGGAMGEGSGVRSHGGLSEIATLKSGEVTASTASTESALHLIQALTGLERPPRLWLVTRGAVPVGEERGPLALQQSPLWGFGRTCSIEHPELWGGLVDLDPEGTAEEAARQLRDVFFRGDSEDQVAFRHGTAFVARLVRASVTPAVAPGPEISLRADGCYVVTGGLDGVGYETARWMIGRGARHLFLLGRKKVPQVEKLTALEDLGARVEYVSADVADETAMSAFFASLRERGLAVRGAIHAASVWEGQDGKPLVRAIHYLEDSAVRTVFRPKVTGSWLLQHHLADHDYDFLVFFSSAASICGSPGQGNYAAAGSFLDALAHHLRSRGKPVLSVNWGPIAGAGFGVSREGLKVHELWESQGIYRITVSQVLAALGRFLRQGQPQIGVMKIDWRLLGDSFPQIARMPWGRALFAGKEIGKEIEKDPEKGSGGEGELTGLLTRPAAERPALLREYLLRVIARSLRLPPERVDESRSITTLGLDSLVALELRNRIQADVKVAVPIVKLLQGPSIAGLAEYLAGQLEVPATLRATPPAPAPPSAEDAQDLVDAMSDAEVDAMLQRLAASQASRKPAHG